jgi:hypothetical protein
VTGSSPPRTLVWEWRRSAVWAQTVTSGWAFVLTIAAEHRRATAATQRYEELKRKSHQRDDPVADIARRIYAEFYSDG